MKGKLGGMYNQRRKGQQRVFKHFKTILFTALRKHFTHELHTILPKALRQVAQHTVRIESIATDSCQSSVLLNKLIVVHDSVVQKLAGFFLLGCSLSSGAIPSISGVVTMRKSPTRWYWVEPSSAVPSGQPVLTSGINNNKQ